MNIGSGPSCCLDLWQLDRSKYEVYSSITTIYLNTLVCIAFAVVLLYTPQ